MVNWLRNFLPEIFELVPPPSSAEKAAQLIDYLAGQITIQDRTADVLARAAGFADLSPEARYDALPGAYLLIEQYLAEIDPARRLNRRELRSFVRDNYGELLFLAPFALIFRDESVQTVALCCWLVGRALELAGKHVAEAAGTVPSPGHTLLAADIEAAIAWLQTVPDASSKFPFGLKDRLPVDSRDWLALLRRLSLTLFDRLAENVGTAAALAAIEASYNEVADGYLGLESFPVVIRMLPEVLLDEHKIGLLSHVQIQRTLIDNVDQLARMNVALTANNRELEAMQAEMVGAREAALSSSLQFWAVLDTVGDAILTFNASGQIVLANQMARTYWGIEELDPHDLFVQELVVDENETLFANSVSVDRPVIQPFALDRRFELTGRRLNRQLFPIEIHVTVTSVGTETLYTAAVLDITERKRAEMAIIHARDLALEASEWKGRLMATVGHDLRTPLSAILGYADMLREKVVGDLNERQLRMVGRILLSGQQMATMLGDLLDQTRLESGQLEIVYRPISLARLVDQLTTIVGLMAREKDLSLVMEVDPALPPIILGDEQRLVQILLNLTGNAIKFTDNGQISVSLLKSGEDEWSMVVSDTGRGIPGEALGSIFEPFAQVYESDGGQEHRGFGLGLSIVTQLVELMDGKISVRSQLGHGSVFTVTLGLREPVGQENE